MLNFIETTKGKTLYKLLAGIFFGRKLLRLKKIIPVPLKDRSGMVIGIFADQNYQVENNKAF